MKHSVITFLLCVFCISCSYRIESTNTPDTPSIKSNHIRSQEDAIQILRCTLNDLYGNTTKSSDLKTIKSIEVITYEDLFIPKTKNTNTLNIDDQIAYLVNFENNEGYAILGADNRMVPIISIVDTGYLDLGLFRLINDNIATYNLPLNELFCEEDGDYMVGMRGQTTGLSIVLAYLNYTILDIRTDNEDTSGPGAIDTPSPEPPSISGPVDDIELDIKPILKTKWGQYSPFNDKVTYVLDNDEKAPAGCTTIAALQILAHNQDVDLECFNLSTQYDWNDLERSVYHKLTEEDDGYTARLDSLYRIGALSHIEELQIELMYTKLRNLSDCISTITKDMMDRIGVSYDYLGSGGTFATPQRVLECLRDLGYNQIHKCNGYSLTQIKNMLYDHKPVFIAALGPGGGHAWVIDGIKTRTIQDENSETESREQVLLHCNWGWNGSSNGYYESKIFDTIDGTVEYDEYSANASQLSLIENEYSFWFRILTY